MYSGIRQRSKARLIAGLDTYTLADPLLREDFKSDVDSSVIERIAELDTLLRG